MKLKPMINLSLIAALAALSFAGSSAEAATKKKSVKPAHSARAGASKKTATSAMSRDVVFDGSYVNGRYHSAGEAVAKVESEKQLNDLIGVRRDFKDRLALERARLKSGISSSGMGQ